jgi:hypothetical protein
MATRQSSKSAKTKAEAKVETGVIRDSVVGPAVLWAEVKPIGYPLASVGSDRRADRSPSCRGPIGVMSAARSTPANLPRKGSSRNSARSQRSAKFARLISAASSTRAGHWRKPATGQTTSGNHPLAARRIDPLAGLLTIEAAPAERVVPGVHRGIRAGSERLPLRGERRRGGTCGPPWASRGSDATSHSQSRPKPRGGSMLASSSRSRSRSRSKIACKASPVTPPRSASGNPSS